VELLIKKNDNIDFVSFFLIHLLVCGINRMVLYFFWCHIEILKIYNVYVKFHLKFILRQKKQDGGQSYYNKDTVTKSIKVNIEDRKESEKLQQI
jgi:hypothetical protein